MKTFWACLLKTQWSMCLSLSLYIFRRAKELKQLTPRPYVHFIAADLQTNHACQLFNIYMPSYIHTYADMPVYESQQSTPENSMEHH